MNDSVSISLQKAVYQGQNMTVRVRSEYGHVFAAFNDRVLEMKTPAAHRMGLELVKKGGEAAADELVIVKINGKEIQFDANNAKQVGGALLRKADDADDFQQQRTSK